MAQNNKRKEGTPTGLYPTSLRIEQDAVSETWRPLPPRPAPERFRFRRQQRENGAPVMVASNPDNADATTNRKEWDGRIKLRASSWRQTIDQERLQRQAMAASASTHQLREIATRRTKLLALNCRLEEELRREETEERLVRGEGKCDDGDDGDDGADDADDDAVAIGKKNEHVRGHPIVGAAQKAPLLLKLPTYTSTGSRMVATRKTKKAASGGGGSSEKKVPGTGTTSTTALTRHVPYLHFITRKIERGEYQENRSVPVGDNDGKHEEGDGRSAHSSPPSTSTGTSASARVEDSPAPLAEVVTTKFSSPSSRSQSNEKKEAQVTNDDLVTKVKELEDRLKRLGGDHSHHVDLSGGSNASASSSGVSIGEVSDQAGVGDIGTRSADARTGAAIFKELTESDDLLGDCGSTCGEDGLSQSPYAHRPRPSVLPAMHTNVPLHPSHAHPLLEVPVADISASPQETKPIAFEGIVYGSLIDSIP